MVGLLNKIKPYRNKRDIIIHDQTTGDIIKGIEYTHNLHRKDYDNIANYFNDDSVVKICRKIYNFLKKNTIYKIESDDAQTLRSPAAILKLGANPKIGLDCKSYALFTAGILDALNRQGKRIKWCYRFASYKIFSKLPHHVFVVVNPNTNNEIWIDNVMPTFNFKKKYNYKIDKNMSLIAISGIGRRKSKAERKEQKKKIINRVKNKIKQGGKLYVKLNPATVTGRNAFLLLVKLNVFNLAGRLNKLISINEPKLKKFWSNIGGDYSTLLKNIKLGARKKPKKPSNNVNGIGEVVVATTVATATPILVKILALLKQVGIEPEDIKKAAKDIITNVAKDKIDKFAENEIKKEDANFEAENESENEAENESENESENEIAGINYY